MWNDVFRPTWESIKSALGVKSLSKETIAEETVEAIEDEITEEATTETIEVPAEEWVWVGGFKGMDENMQCFGNFQYALGKRYDMADEEVVETCRNGFHMCLNLTDVFGYVKIGDNNRFFQVRALVRKRDLDNYCSSAKDLEYIRWVSIGRTTDDKLAAKSIEIVRELTVDEILKSWGDDEWDEKYKQLAVSVSVEYAIKTMQIDELTLLGYSEPFAGWIVENNKYNIAKIVASQPELCMDMRALYIINEK